MAGLIALPSVETIMFIALWLITIPVSIVIKFVVIFVSSIGIATTVMLFGGPVYHPAVMIIPFAM